MRLLISRLEDVSGFEAFERMENKYNGIISNCWMVFTLNVIECITNNVIKHGFHF